MATNVPSQESAPGTTEPVPAVAARVPAPATPIPAAGAQGWPVTHIKAQDQASGPVPALTPAPQPGSFLPEHPGKEVSADAHDEENVPILGYVDHRITGTDGNPIDVHTPGVILFRQPAKPDSGTEPGTDPAPESAPQPVPQPEGP